ncbi:phytoene/squalene synthase family protein [Aciduricibacillus chroicocephali]|uniref:Phytoene/squalene synthase family protein n=1 Tax=Aciduricibacillus chroicocephali TaxID=3054939 RepID=A0ABY9KWI1_9BACI|nr:phytoene/squalene synthase family protein [Bacillaceae bacterium 44XB]
MTDSKLLEKQAMEVLKETSRTFFIPIKLLHKPLRLTVGSAYLCMRAIDEIEDDEKLSNDIKEQLLMETAQLLKEPFDSKAYNALLEPYAAGLPEVTLRLGDWIEVCPAEIRAKVLAATSEMAQGMAKWSRKNWSVHTEADLDDYTYYVAGLVGVMLSDIWNWHDGTKTDRDQAIAFGRGLQAVNILRNKDEDMAERGVGFFPDGWGRQEMFAYAEKNLDMAELYIADIGNRNIRHFCKIPLSLARRTLKALKRGEEKMSRREVEEAVEEVLHEQ